MSGPSNSSAYSAVGGKDTALKFDFEVAAKSGEIQKRSHIREANARIVRGSRCWGLGE